jgi:hypothetical protein
MNDSLMNHKRFIDGSRPKALGHRQNRLLIRVGKKLESAGLLWFQVTLLFAVQFQFEEFSCFPREYFFRNSSIVLSVEKKVA